MESRKIHYPQNVRKTESVCQAKKEGYSIALDRTYTQQILQRHIYDAQSDDAFRQASRQHHDIKSRKRKGNAVCNRERSDDLDQRPKICGHDQETNKKCQMVVSSEDVHNPEAEKTPESPQSRSVVRGKDRSRVRRVEDCFVNCPVQIRAGEMLMARSGYLIESGGHAQLRDILGKFINDFGIQHMIFDHSVPFKSALNRECGTLKNIVPFDIRINSANRVV